MNEKNNSALVPRPPSALEKAEPGAKRILSGMIADTLALAKKEPLAKPVFTALIGHMGDIGDVLEMVTEFELGKYYDLRFFRFGDYCGFYVEHEAELLRLAESLPFDLILVFYRGPDQQLFARLKAQYGKPIIVVSDYGAEVNYPFEGMGIPVLSSPFLIEDFRRALQEANIP